MASVKPKARDDLTVVELDGEAVIYDERDDGAPPPEPDRDDRVRPVRRQRHDGGDGRGPLRRLRGSASRGGAGGPRVGPAIPEGAVARVQ